MVNDRWGKARGKRGDFYTQEYQYDAINQLIGHKWENTRGLGQSFGYNANEPLEAYMSVDALVDMFVSFLSWLPIPPTGMASNSPDWLREIDHTGDVGIQVTAPTLPELFERAATGTFRVLTDLNAVRPTDATTITVDGRDREALMVRWLSELNYRHTVDDVLYGDFEVESIADTDDGLSLTATARGEPIDLDRHTVYTEIKAITFHGMEVRETHEGWTVQVIFDM